MAGPAKAGAEPLAPMTLQELHRAHLKRTAELFGEQASLRGGDGEDDCGCGGEP